MDSDKRTRIEYEHQFFQFSSDTLIDAYKNMVNEIIPKSIDKIKNSIHNKLEPAAKDINAVDSALEEMGNTLCSNYRSGVDYALSKLEKKIKECFEIPSNVLLPEDQVVATVRGVDSDELDKEISDMKLELKNIAYLIEEAKNEEIIANDTIALLESCKRIQTYPLPDSL